MSSYCKIILLLGTFLYFGEGMQPPSSIQCPPGKHYAEGLRKCIQFVPYNELLVTNNVHDSINNRLLCKLPSYPMNGFYNVTGLPNAQPGQEYLSVTLSYSCYSGYQLFGSRVISCSEFQWNHNFPRCVSQCALKKNLSVKYWCLPDNSTNQNDAEVCEDLVLDVTKVRAECREPNYHYTGNRLDMRCINGQWDHIVVCSTVNEGSLPPFPKNGYYIVNELPYAHPGQTFDAVFLNFTCHSGYKLVGTKSSFCTQGWWSDNPPVCISQCLLKKHPSVEYLCLTKNSSSYYGAQECEELVEDGTVVKTTCREHYYYTGVLVNMHCTNGLWNIINVCSPQCGLVTSEGEPMILGGRKAKRGELPWHAGIYRKQNDSYAQICGGSLISTTVIISAAHCFWTELEKQLPVSNFAVAVGKLYRPWNDPRDVDAQKSDVRQIKIPLRFLGEASNFQDDIAVVIVETEFEFRSYVRPVCLDFDLTFSRRQLYPGVEGKVAGWGLTEEDEGPARELQVTELPYVDIATCFSSSPSGFFKYITSDKICAGVINGTARTVCEGDSGGGLAFLAYERGAERYFLRGVVSTKPTNEHRCNKYNYAFFTQVIKHEEFIKENLQ